MKKVVRANHRMSLEVGEVQQIILMAVAKRTTKKMLKQW